jgi:hypothetical protein
MDPVTRLGLVGPSAAYLPFTPKEEEEGLDLAHAVVAGGRRDGWRIGRLVPARALRPRVDATVVVVGVSARVSLGRSHARGGATLSAAGVWTTSQWAPATVTGTASAGVTTRTASAEVGQACGSGASWARPVLRAAVAAVGQVHVDGDEAVAWAPVGQEIDMAWGALQRQAEDEDLLLLLGVFDR